MAFQTTQAGPVRLSHMLYQKTVALALPPPPIHSPIVQQVRQSNYFETPRKMSDQQIDE